MTLKEEAQEEKEKLKHMSWKDRIWYIWEYYKFHMLFLLIAIMILWIIGTALYRQSFTTRLSIAIINDRSGGNSSSDPLMAGLRETLNCQKKDMIEINEGLFLDTNEETMSQYSYASMVKIAALVSGGMLDIMIADEATIRHYESVDAYMGREKGKKKDYGLTLKQRKEQFKEKRNAKNPDYAHKAVRCATNSGKILSWFFRLQSLH